LKDEKLIILKKQTYVKSETCKLCSRVLNISANCHMPIVMKINLYIF